MLLRVYNVHEKTTQKVRTNEILNFFEILHLCYIRMYSFSANQKCILFLMYIITKIKFEGAGYAAMTSLVLNLDSGQKY